MNFINGKRISTVKNCIEEEEEEEDDSFSELIKLILFSIPGWTGLFFSK